MRRRKIKNSQGTYVVRWRLRMSTRWWSWRRRLSLLRLIKWELKKKKTWKCFKIKFLRNQFSGNNIANILKNILINYLIFACLPYLFFFYFSRPYHCFYILHIKMGKNILLKLTKVRLTFLGVCFRALI